MGFIIVISICVNTLSVSLQYLSGFVHISCLCVYWNEIGFDYITILCCRCDGGVCNNDFVMQLISNLIGVSIDRPSNMDMTSVGAAFLAGLAVGQWLISLFL